MKFNLIAFPSDRFTYDKNTFTFTSEALDMDDRHLQRIYNDACDVGFAVKLFTDEIVTFVLSKVVKDKGGDITSWEYVLTEESIRQYPVYSSFKATVFND